MHVSSVSRVCAVSVPVSVTVFLSVSMSVSMSVSVSVSVYNSLPPQKIGGASSHLCPGWCLVSGLRERERERERRTHARAHGRIKTRTHARTHACTHAHRHQQASGKGRCEMVSKPSFSTHRHRLRHIIYQGPLKRGACGRVCMLCVSLTPPVHRISSIRSMGFQNQREGAVYWYSIQ